MMKTRRLLFTVIFSLLALVLAGTAALADNGPHGGYTPTTDACAGCHRAHTAPTGRLLLDDVPNLCYTCHGSAGAGADTDVLDGIYLERDFETETPAEGVHNQGLKGGGFQTALMDTDALTSTAAVVLPTTSSHLADGSMGTAWGNGPLGSGPGPADFSLSCVSCHDPHGGGNYRILRSVPINSGASAPITITDEISKTYTVADAGNDYISQLYGVLNTPLGSWCSQCHTRYMAGSGSGRVDSGDPIFRYRHTTTSVSCVRCHVAHGSTATMGGFAANVEWPDGATMPDGDARSSLLRLDNRGVCAYCHLSEDGTIGGGCTSCHGGPPLTGSHPAHFTSPSGPQIPAGQCDDCHYFSGDTHMDGEVTMYSTLAETDTCDVCHSPDGPFDGVEDLAFGAKANWYSGVYDAGGTLAPGKEMWCAGCHDTGTSIVQGVSAPPVVGDDTTWGYFQNGHGRNDFVACTDCHDATSIHVDGLARTYSFDSADYDPGQSGVSYASGYRLRDVAGEAPLMIPANYNITFGYDASLMRDTAFRLCFECHDSSKVFDNTPGDGIDSNFKASLPNPPRDYSYAWGSGADVNEHVAHVMNYVGSFADSDWDTATNGPGGSNGNDTLTNCSSCHNVHGAAGAEGSTNEAMVRDGSLIGRTGYGFSYVIEDTGSGGYPWVTSTGATQSNSVGSIFRNNTSDTCAGSMCHDGPAPPPDSSYDATGSGWGTYLEYYREPVFTGGCAMCHDSPPPTGSHAAHAGEGAVGYDLTGSFATDTAYQYGCGECHPTDFNQHQNGTVDLDLSPSGAPAGSLKSRNAATASYSAGSCDGVYCHSGLQVASGPVGLPLDDGLGNYIFDEHGNLTYDPYVITETIVFQTTPAWEGGQITTCDACHQFPLTTSYPDVEAAVGDGHQWIGADGFGNLHAWNMGFDPLACRTCHYGEVTQANTWTRVGDVSFYDPVPLASRAMHANGQADVAFDTVNDAVYTGWSGTTVHELDTAAFIPAEQACTNVGCHLQQNYVQWGTPYRWETNECDLCHRYALPSPPPLVSITGAAPQSRGNTHTAVRSFGERPCVECHTDAHGE